jgi:parallel beta-helix repeat protein
VIEGTAGASRWVIKGNVISNNTEKGIDARVGWRVLDNIIHKNGRYGLTGSGEDIVIAGNEISYNSTDGATGDAGGTKFVHTVGLILRDNYVHHNYGHGLHVDINNVDALIEGNRLVGNRRAGVFIEISCGGTIRNNRVEGNGFDNPFPNWMAGSSGVQVSDSPNVKVYGNTLSGNAKGIGGLQVDHENLGAVSKCDPKLKNLKVYDNVITQSGGAAAGLDANNNEGSVWSTWGNTFEGNTYKLSNGARFRWEGDWRDKEEWQAKGLG